MKTIWNLILFTVLVSILAAGCNNGGNTTQMRIATLYFAGGLQLGDPNAVVNGFTFDPLRDNINTITNFFVTTDNNGVAVIKAVNLPASWAFTRFPTANCNRTDNFTAPLLGNPATVNLLCGLTVATLQVAPAPINYLNPPGWLTVSNNKNLFSAVWGMPSVSIYDASGTLISTATSNWLAADKNSLTVPFTRKFNMFTDTYAVVVRNIQANGTQVVAGGASVDIINHDPPPPPDPGPCRPHSPCPL